MTPPLHRSWLRRTLNRFEVDQAVFFAVAARGWQLLAGPLVMLLVAQFFTPEMQGFHFTFTKLLALQAFVELGLRIVLLNAAGHEWASLSLDDGGRIQGDRAALSRLISLGRLAVGWYGAASVVFALGVGYAGVRFFSAEPTDVTWLAPWLAVVVLTALQIELIPLLALLDGCGQMPVVHRYRFGQAVCATLAAVACIAAGGGLWTGPAVVAARLLGDVFIVVVRYRRFFAPFLLPADGPSVRWREEILPLQWRLAAQSLLVWFAYSLFEPVLFRSAGAVEAGRFGMTWAALAAAQAGALAWVDTRIPLFSALVARGEFGELDRVYARVTRIGFALLVLAEAVFCLLVVALAAAGHRYAERLLPLSTTLLIAGSLLSNFLVTAMNHYLRAHRSEPAFIANLTTNALCGAAVAYGGWHYGSFGAALAFFVAQTCVALPWCAAVRRAWRSNRHNRRATN